MTPEQIDRQIVIPEDISYVSVKAEEAAFLYQFVMEHDLQRTLETGLGFGRSAIHIMAAHGNRHIAIDPFQEDYGYQALHNVEAGGFKEQFDFYEDYSHHVLPWLAREEEKFDFIFIDGDHKFDGILVDFYYADLLLPSGGYIAFHDSWMRSTQLVASFIRSNKNNYKEIKTPYPNFIFFQKTSESDGRDGMHFRGFYTYRSILRHKLISWMVSPGESVAKRLAIRLKNMLK